MERCCAVWRSVINVRDAEDGDWHGTETLKNHRHKECSQVTTSIIHLNTGAPVTGVIIITLIVMFKRICGNKTSLGTR